MGENCGSYNTVRCGHEEIPSDAVPVRTEEFMTYIQERRQQRDQDQNEEDDDT